MQVAIGPSSFAAVDQLPLKILEEHRLKVVPNPFQRRLSQAEIISHLKDADGLIAGLEPLNREVLESATRLKAIARVGIGMDNVDQKAAIELGIKVSNTPAGPTEAVAEMCLTALLALKRELITFNQDLHQGKWQKRIGMGLRNSKVLLIGYGRIGRRFGEHLRSLGAKTMIYDPAINKFDLAHGEKKVSLRDGLRDADVISLHASGLDKIIGEEEFSIMKQGVIILNSARGSLIDEEDLVQALNRSIIKGAWLDVYSGEPYEGPLMNYDQVLLTPHISTYTIQCRRSMEENAVQNLIQDLNLSYKKG
jgi:D-3-phosphoglycerate dehydrogenase